MNKKNEKNEKTDVKKVETKKASPIKKKKKI